MKFTLGWLKEHLDTDADVDTIAETLTRIGLEVEGVENAGEKLGEFLVAKVLTAEPHPNADKLQLLTVDAGGDPAPGGLWCTQRARGDGRGVRAAGRARAGKRLHVGDRADQGRHLARDDVFDARTRSGRGA